MKKNIGVLSIALIPTISFAAGTAITGSTKITDTQCSLFQESVTIGLSTGVVGGYNCDTTNGLFAVATCHTSGRKGERNATYSVPLGCSGTAASSCTGTTSGQISGSLVFKASTAGGSLSTDFSAGQACDTAGSVAAGKI